MTKQEIVLSDKVKNITNEDYDAIKEAITKLSSVSENQFETIKKEKWFNRVFDLITFSKKNQKRLAEQISTVAQANQILIELLLRLSENDKNISELVCKSLDDIKKLQSQDIYLLSKINRLEDSALGIRKDTDLESLSDDSKKLLCACIYYNSEKYGGSSDNQKRFYNSLCSYIQTDGIQMDNPYASFDRIDSDSKLRIFFACMEYFFLYDCSDDSYDKYEDEIDEFDIGNKSIKQVKQQIKTLYDARGVDGFVNKFELYNNERLLDSFYMEFEDFSENYETIDDNDISSDNKILPIEVDYNANEDECISSMLTIAKGELVVFKNKNIHLKSYIKCYGELKFHNCIIYYNEYESGDEIQMGEEASIIFDGCAIYCKGYDESVFITNTDNCNNKFTFKNSSFYDCSYFIKVNNVSKAIIENCYFHNCFKGFMNVSLKDDAEFIMDSNYFKLYGICTFNLSHIDRFHNTIINIESQSYEDSLDLCITNMLIEESIQELSEAKDKDMILLDANRIKLRQSTILGLTKDIRVQGVYNCYMKDCVNGFIICGWAYEIASEIKDCLFDNCTEIIKHALCTSLTISDSNFVSCYGQITNDCPQVKIEKCNFYNTKYIIKKDRFLPLLSWEKGCIGVREAGSYIKDCIFDGIELDGAYLIAGTGLDSSAKNICSVSGCYFLNWKKRDNDKIINEYSEYYGMFNKKKTVKSIDVSSNCKGLDKSNGTGTSDKSQEEMYNIGNRIVGSNINLE